MGHIRLGPIPKTHKWNTVVTYVLQEGPFSSENGNEITDRIKDISSLAIDAAENLIKTAKKDVGVSYIFFVLSKTAFAVRKENWIDELNSLGIKIPENPTIFDVVSGFNSFIDDYLFENGLESDFSEIAQKSASLILSNLSKEITASLFHCSKDETVEALRKISTKKGFGKLGQEFFGLFTAQLLNFVLSRITAKAIGTKRVKHLGDITQFNDSLFNHCKQSALIVRDFSSAWLSKTEFEIGISPTNVKKFVAFALEKISAELGRQRGNGDEQ